MRIALLCAVAAPLAYASLAVPVVAQSDAPPVSAITLLDLQHAAQEAGVGIALARKCQTEDGAAEGTEMAARELFLSVPEHADRLINFMQRTAAVEPTEGCDKVPETLVSVAGRLLQLTVELGPQVPAVADPAGPLPSHPALP